MRCVNGCSLQVDLAVNSREEKTQINVMLQAGNDNPPPPPVRAPDAPFGAIAANPIPLNDTAKRTYHSLYLGPGKLTSSLGRTDHRVLTGQSLSIFTSQMQTILQFHIMPPCKLCWQKWVGKSQPEHTEKGT